MPAAIALFLTGDVKETESRWMSSLKNGYAKLLDQAYTFKYVVVTAAISILLLTAVMSTRVGTEFSPTLSEGDFALQLLRAPSTGIEESLRIQEGLEKQLLKEFPEIKAIFSRTGTAEVATDVMPPNISDSVVHYILVSAHTKLHKPRMLFVRGACLQTIIAGIRLHNQIFVHPKLISINLADHLVPGRMRKKQIGNLRTGRYVLIVRTQH